MNFLENQNVNAKIRCFVAILLNEQIKSQLRRIQTDIRATGIHAGWPAADNFHLTLKFLGEIPEQILPDMKSILSEAVTGNASFDISFNRLGVFPDEHHPKIIWVGPDKPSQELFTLQQDIESRLNKDLKLAKEKRFSPHITLSRVRHGSKPSLIKKAIGIKTDRLKISVDQVHLIKSKLLPSGAVHASLFHINLQSS